MCYCVRLAPSGESYGGNCRPNENNSSLPPSGWFKITCGLTACSPGSAPGPTLGKEYEKTLPLLFRYRKGMYSKLYAKNLNGRTTVVGVPNFPVVTKMQDKTLLYVGHENVGQFYASV